MLKSEMLECIISYYSDGNKAKFSSKLGVKPQTISAWIARNTFDAELIYSKCSEISADWLLNGGNGNMLKQDTNTATANGSNSIASINSHVTTATNDTIQAERIKHLEELLAEKERVIQLYEKMMAKEL